MTFLFIPGAWHRPEIWNKVIADVQSRGYRGVGITLPSTTGDTSLGFGDDVKSVQEAIRNETSQGHDVVLVVHSYGGHVGNSAIKGFNPATITPSENGTGKVIGLAMIATGFTMTGVAFLDAIGGQPPPEWKADTENGLATIIVDPTNMLYHDLDPEDAKYWVSQLTTQSLLSLTNGGEYAYAGWKDVPCWFLVTTEDRAAPNAPQMFAAFIAGARGEGADVTMKEVKSGHSPMLSRPKETADFVVEAVQDFVRKAAA